MQGSRDGPGHPQHSEQCRSIRQASLGRASRGVFGQSLCWRSRSQAKKQLHDHRPGGQRDISSGKCPRRLRAATARGGFHGRNDHVLPSMLRQQRCLPAACWSAWMKLSSRVFLGRDPFMHWCRMMIRGWPVSRPAARLSTSKSLRRTCASEKRRQRHAAASGENRVRSLPTTPLRRMRLLGAMIRRSFRRTTVSTNSQSFAA